MTLYKPVGNTTQFTDETGRAQDIDSIMEIDHVIRVLKSGNVTDSVANIYAPEVHNGEWEGDEWTEFSHGYTGQHRILSPMHDSEYVGGQLATDMLERPGFYVVVDCKWDGDHDPDGEEYEDGVAEGWMLMHKSAD